jgi:hypothetical protein
MLVEHWVESQRKDGLAQEESLWTLTCEEEKPKLLEDQKGKSCKTDSENEHPTMLECEKKGVRLSLVCFDGRLLRYQLSKEVGKHTCPSAHEQAPLILKLIVKPTYVVADFFSLFLDFNTFLSFFF